MEAAALRAGGMSRQAWCKAILNAASGFSGIASQIASAENAQAEAENAQADKAHP